MADFPVAGYDLLLDYRDLSDGAVSSWADQSANGYDFAQATGAAQPVKGATGVVFDGTDDYLSNTDTSLADIINSEDYTIWMFARSNDYTNNKYLFSLGNSGAGNSTLAWYRGVSDALEYAAFIRDQSGSSPSFSGEPGPAQIYGEFESLALTSDSAANKTRAYIGGTLSNFADRTPSHDVEANQFALGCLLRTSASSYHNCTFQHLAVFDSALGTSDLADLRDWAYGELYGSEASSSGGGGASVERVP